MQLPEGWQLESIYDLCDFTRGLTYKKTDEIDFSSQVVLRANNISLTSGLLDFSDLRYINESVKIDNSKIIKKDSLLICTASGSKSHLGKVALIDKDYPYAFGGFMGLITPKDIIDSRYLYWFTQSKYYKDYIAALTDGANINNLKFSQLKLCYIPFPKKNKQKRIVAILDEAFAGINQAIANTEKNLANARELFESYQRNLFESLGDGWSWKKLTEMSENLDSQRIPITKSQRSSGAIPYYGASGIVDYVEDFIFDEDLLLVSEDGANLLARTYPIAFSISGKTWVNNHAHVLRFENYNLQKLIEYYLNSINLVNYVSGMAQPKLNQKALNSIPVPVPDSVEKAKQIIKQLNTLSESVSTLEYSYQQKLHSLTELKQSLLQKAFSGELTANNVDKLVNP